MYHHIENLRSKPKHIRKAILYVSTPLITIVIASLWYLGGGMNENENKKIATDIVTEVAVAESTSLLQEVTPKEIFSQDLLKFFSNINLSGIFDSINLDGVVQKTREMASSIFTSKIFVEQYERQETDQQSAPDELQQEKAPEN